MEGALRVDENIDTYASALVSAIAGRRTEDAGPALRQMLRYSEMSETLEREVESFKAFMMIVNRLTPQQVEGAVIRLAKAAKKAGPNDEARAMLLD